MEIAAATVAFIDFSLKLFNAAQSYKQSVKNYPKALDDFLLELRVVKENHERLLPFIEQSPGKYLALGDQIKRCNEQLSSFHDALIKHSATPASSLSSRAKAKLRRVVWPLTENELKEYLALLRGYGSHFNLAVGLDTNQRVVKIEQFKLEEKDAEILRWLSTVEFRQKHDSFSQQRRYNTGGWLVSNAKYQRWENKEQPGSVLWLNGIHGSGKTILMSMVIDRVILGNSEEDDAGAFLYCTFDDRETTDPPAILRSILVQLVSRRVEKARAMLDEFERRMKQGQGTPAHLDELVDKITLASGFYRRTTIIVDGLDECDIERREDLISRLITLPERSNGRIRLLISSRPELDIQELLMKEPGKVCPREFISLMQESGFVKSDLEKYIEGRFGLTRRLSKITGPLKAEIITALTERETFFQLVRCQLDEISRCRSEDAIRKALADLPRDLNETYRRVLDRIQREEDVQFATHTFLWLAVSRRPLKLEEVVASLAAKPGMTSLPRKQLILRDSELLEICGSLATFDEQTGHFSLSHFSVKEFLTSGWLASGAVLSKFHIEQIRAEQTLAISTLTYLSFDDFRHTSSGNISDTLLRAKLLEYAAGYWTDHAKAAGDDDMIYSLSKRLLLDPAYQENYRLFLRTRVQAEHLKSTSTMSHIIKSYDPSLSPLYYPVLCGVTGIVKRFIELHPSWLDQPIGQYGTPLIIAAGQDDDKMIKALMSLGADINEPCRTRLWNEIRPLYYAVYLGNRAATEILIQKGANINLGARYLDNHSNYGSPLLFTAAYWGNAEMVTRLIKAGADVNVTDSSGYNALHNALSGASVEVVRILCENGVNPLQKGASGKSAVQHALELRNGSIIEYLVNSLTDRDAQHAFGDMKMEHLEWAKSEEWYQRAVHLLRVAESNPTEQPKEVTPSGVYQVYSILNRKLGLPKKISLRILDLGEWWIKREVERKEPIVVTENDPDSPYVSITPRGAVRRIIFRTLSHDQGYSGEPEHHGKYSGSHTWFEVGIIRAHEAEAKTTEEARWERHLLQRNVCAVWEARAHRNEWLYVGSAADRKSWFESIEAGDAVGLYPRAQFPGWMNHVEEGKMELWYALA